MFMSNSQIEIYLEEMLLSQLSKGEVGQSIKKYADLYRESMAYYRCAMISVSTKFNVLNEELSLQCDHNPIETIKTRLKSPESILEKVSRKQLAFTAEDIEQNINDIAGVRVICSFLSDIYMLSNALLKQDDVRLIQMKDYIISPKVNGYRSLHLIIEVPIFLHDKKKLMKVEVQLRTISMDWWASLEHKICYKKDFLLTEQTKKELYECAKISADLDARMEKIHLTVENGEKSVMENQEMEDMEKK